MCVNVPVVYTSKQVRVGHEHRRKCIDRWCKRVFDAQSKCQYNKQHGVTAAKRSNWQQPKKIVLFARLSHV